MDHGLLGCERAYPVLDSSACKPAFSAACHALHHGPSSPAPPQVLLNATYAAASRRVGALMQARYRVRPPLMRAADEVELALMAAGAAANGVAAAGNESQMPAAAGGHSEL